MRRLDSIAGSIDMNLSKLLEIVKDRRAWHAAFHGIAKSQTWLSDWMTADKSKESILYILYKTSHAIQTKDFYKALWRRQWHPTPVLLPGKSHGWRSLVGCSPRGRWEVDTTQWLHFHFSLSGIGEGNATHSSVLAWRIPGTAEPGGLPSMGSYRVGHKWSNLAAADSTYGKRV